MTANFASAPVSSDGGVLLLRAVVPRLGMAEAPDRLNPGVARPRPLGPQPGDDAALPLVRGPVWV